MIDIWTPSGETQQERRRCLGDDWERGQGGLYLPRQTQPKIAPTGVSLFTGAGGFDVGMVMAGFHVLAASDNDFWATCTYLYNMAANPCCLHFITEQDERNFLKHLPETRKKETGGNGKQPLLEYSDGWARINRGEDHPGFLAARPDLHPTPHFFFGDVRSLTGHMILDATGMRQHRIGCVFGGPPCQGFSTSGKRDIMDPRNSLVFEFARLVLEIRPKTLVMENVPGILSMVTPEGLPVLDVFCKLLSDGGFGEYSALKRALLASSGAGAAMQGKPRAQEDDEAVEPDQLALAL